MTIDCSKITDEPATPEPSDAADDADWRQPIPHRRDLLSYAQARKDWKYDDATLAGLINTNRISAFKEENGQLLPFNWLGMLPTHKWRTQLPTLLLKPVPDFELESETRYLDYPATLALLKKHNPKLDAVAMLIQEVGAATGELNWGLLAISLTSGELTPDSLVDSIYILSQVQSLIDRITVKVERTRRNGAWRDKFGNDNAAIRKAILTAYKTMNQEEVAEFLEIPLYYVKLETEDETHHQTGPEKKRSSDSYSDNF